MGRICGSSEIFSPEWKSECMMDGESGDGEDDV